ncbi:MAG: hypothetical protein ACXVCY_06425 [Pseudobdellovibrionaceae bacterium]
MAKKISTLKKAITKSKKTPQKKSRSTAKDLEEPKVQAKVQAKTKVKTKGSKENKPGTITKPSKRVSREKVTVESTLETPREPSREIESPDALSAQPKMKLNRKNERNYREIQQSLAKPNSVNPASRR